MKEKELNSKITKSSRTLCCYQVSPFLGRLKVTMTRNLKEMLIILKKCQWLESEFPPKLYLFLTQKFKRIEQNNRQPIY